jgi:hypothetical protein
VTRASRFSPAGVEARIQSALDAARDTGDMLYGSAERGGMALVFSLLMEARDEAREVRKLVEKADRREKGGQS